MLTIIERLKGGDNRIPMFFARAEDIWAMELEGMTYMPLDMLADKLRDIQGQIERVCGSRMLGKELMPWSAFAHLYNCGVGFEEQAGNAAKLRDAFKRSLCSIEVKRWAEDAAKAYRVEDIQA